jgi:hypothetical protein
MKTRKSNGGVNFGSVFDGKHVVGKITITVKAKKTVTEKDFHKLMSDVSVNVSPLTHNHVYGGSYVIRRKLDGQLYLVQKWSSYVAVFSSSQLRFMLNADDEKIAANRKQHIRMELKRRGALA